jgi:GxxExxY protein
MVQVDSYEHHVNKILEAETFLIARAAKMVYQKIGAGLGESVYREALQKEFDQRRIKYKKNCPDLETSSPQTFRPDYLCFGNMILYTMAAETVSQRERQQLRECLQKLNLPLGVIVNFGREEINLEMISR